MSRLTDTLILAAPLPSKGYAALTDGQRLFLRVTPDGGRYWRLKFVAAGGKESQASLGKYPEVSIEQARTLADAIREQAAKGRNPVREKRQAKEQADDIRALTFGRVAQEWLDHLSDRQERTRLKHQGEIDKLSKLHNLPLTEIKPSQVREILRAIEATGKAETAKRVGQTASNIFGFAAGAHDIVHNPARDRKGWLKPVKAEHHAGITDPAQLSLLVRMVYGFESLSKPTVNNALRLTLHTGARQGELCSMEWAEVNFDTATWLAQPKAKSKLKAPHVVPLSRQSLAILAAQKAHSGQGRYVFPHAVRDGRHMSTEAVGAALGALGYTSAEQTPHGFRTTAATLLREVLRYDSELVERQLSHKVGNAVAGAYDRSQRIAERRDMMQAWSDYLESMLAV